MPTIRTWGRTHQAAPRTLVRPTSEAQIAETVAAAASRGGRVRAHGALHSWSDCALDDDVAMSLDAWSGLTAVSGTTVRVRAGTRLFDLNRLLEAEGLAMPILGSIDHQSVAGAVSTGTHGSSRRHGNLASIVTGMRLVTADGEVHTIGSDDPRLDALRVSLGAAGILTELTLQVVPSFRLEETATPMPIEQAIASIDELSHSAEFVKVWWLPHTGMAVVFRADRTDAPSTFSTLERWADEKVVNKLAFRGILGAGRVATSLVPALNRLVGKAYFRPRQRVGRSHEVFHLAMPPVHREMEYAVPVAHTQQALQQMVDFVRDEAVRVNFIAEVRFVRGDPGWISPAYGEDVCQLGAYIGQCADTDRYYRGFESRMLELGGRPHWGKEFFAPSGTVRSRYPRMGDWLSLIDELDPAGTFRGPFLSRLRS